MASNVLELIVTATDKASAELSKINTKLIEADRAATKASEGWTKLGNATLKAGLAMTAAGAAIVGVMWKMTDSFTKAGEEIYNMSIRTGVSVEALSELKYMAEQSGTSLSSLELNIRSMQRGLYDASQGAGESHKALLQLHLSIQSLMAMNPADQFWTIANALAGVENPTTRAAMALDIFGRSGTDLLPILAEGQMGIEAMKLRAQELGVVFSEGSAAAAKKFQDSMTDLKMSLMGLGGAIAEVVMPVIEDFLANVIVVVTWFKDWAKINPELVKTIGAIGLAFLGFGAAIAIIGGLAKTIIAVNMALTIMNALLGPGGWANLAVAGASIGLAAAGAAVINNQIKEATSYQYGGIVPGPIGQPTPIIAHGGEMFLGEGKTMGGTTVIINNAGSVVTERELAENIRQAFYEIKRNTGSLEMS